VRVPPGARSITARDLAALEALMAGARNVRAVADTADLPVTTCYTALTRLRVLGLAAWEDGKAGTLRPLVRPVTR